MLSRYCFIAFLRRAVVRRHAGFSLSKRTFGARIDIESVFRSWRSSCSRAMKAQKTVRWSMIRLVGFLGATLTLASCADTGQSGGTTLSTLVSPTLTVGAQISPQRLPIANAVTIGCPLVPTTNFDLI